MLNLKKYDKLLSLTKKLNWSIEIERVSELVKWRKNIVLTITNQKCGSWILTKLKGMDSRRKDFFLSSIEKNMAIRRRKSDSRMHQEVADYIRNGEQFVG